MNGTKYISIRFFQFQNFNYRWINFFFFFILNIDFFVTGILEQITHDFKKLIKPKFVKLRSKLGNRNQTLNKYKTNVYTINGVLKVYILYKLQKAFKKIELFLCWQKKNTHKVNAKIHTAVDAFCCHKSLPEASKTKCESGEVLGTPLRDD